MKFGALLPGLCFLVADNGKLPKKLKDYRQGVQSLFDFSYLPNDLTIYILCQHVLTPGGGGGGGALVRIWQLLNLTKCYFLVCTKLRLFL